MSEINDKSEYVVRLLELTRVERYSYLAICMLSVVFLLTCAAITLVRNHGDVSLVVSLFGSSGVITYSTSQIMRVWTDAMRVVLPPAGKGGGDGK